MSFNSVQFLIFLPLVLAAYFAISHRYRWMLLLAASYYFYMSWKAEYLILILVSTLIDYFAGLQIGNSENPQTRKGFLVLSLVANLGILFAFKYFNFFNESARALFDQLNLFYGVHAFEVLLPVGISFYTFQSMSYTIDVFRRKIKPEKHLGIFALYVAFFPQLVAGPIERATRLLPQFHAEKTFKYDRVVSGLRRILWGFVKKMVIADRLAIVVNAVYNSPQEYTGVPLWLATYFFAFQIYYDFSSYSDIAIGTARIFGYDLMENFRTPYLSRSTTEFWRRWHISLSTWFRDYLYIPLGGNRVSYWQWCFNLMVVFVVSGLWHGANWTFVIWGAIHGAMMVIDTIVRSTDLVAEVDAKPGLIPRVKGLFQIVITFHLVVIAWVFFRANSVADAFYIFTHLFVGLEVQSGYGLNMGGMYELSIAVIGILCIETVQIMYEQKGMRTLIGVQPWWVRWAAYYALALCIMLFGKFGISEFIYFQF